MNPETLAASAGPSFDLTEETGRAAWHIPANGSGPAGWTRALFVGVALAYGSSGVPPLIPPNATLVFDVDLLKVRSNGVGPTSATRGKRGPISADHRALPWK